ncbi:MAG: peptidylprolyl isomerase [Desulfomonilia bacterium]
MLYRYTDNILSIALLLCVMLWVSSAHAEMVDGIVAVVDDRVIMYSDLQSKMRDLGIPQQDRSMKNQVLQLMVEDLIVEKIYKSLGLPAVELNEAQEVAAQTGTDIASATSLVMKSTLMDMMVKSRVVVTESMIQSYYQNSDTYTGRKSLHLKQILFKENREKAHKAIEELRSGRDFDDAAREYSDILGSGSSDIGWVAITQLSQAAKEALVDANPGDIVGPIDINDFSIIYQVQEKGIIGHKSLEDVKEEITQILETKSRQEAFDHWLKRIMTDHFIGIYL